jgi:hypothetical protein
MRKALVRIATVDALRIKTASSVFAQLTVIGSTDLAQKVIAAAGATKTEGYQDGNIVYQ